MIISRAIFPVKLRRFPEKTKYLVLPPLTAGSFCFKWHKKEINTNYNLFFFLPLNRVVIYTCRSIISRLTNTTAKPVAAQAVKIQRDDLKHNHTLPSLLKFL